MNVNGSQTHGPILHHITQAESRTTKITVMHHTPIHFSIYFQCEKLAGNEIFLSIFQFTYLH